MLDFILRWDHWLFMQINSAMTHPWADAFFFWITDLHKTVYFKALIVPFVIFLFVRAYKLRGVYLFLLLLVALGVNDFTGARIKNHFTRQRPFDQMVLSPVQRSDAGGHSFPSNHASNMFTFATYTAQFIPQARVPLYLIAGAVAYSRVYNGVHYPSDVFAGSLLGYIWGLLFSRIGRRLLAWLETRKAGTFRTGPQRKVDRIK